MFGRLNKEFGQLNKILCELNKTILFDEQHLFLSASFKEVFNHNMYCVANP